jgi:uncharacterized protein (AIM24 family)
MAPRNSVGMHMTENEVDDETQVTKNSPQKPLSDGFVMGLPADISDSSGSYHSSTFQVLGADSQIVEIDVAPGNVIMTQPGNLVHMSDKFKANIKTGGIAKAFKRTAFSDQTFFRCDYTNSSSEKAVIGLTPQFPAKVIPINLDRINGLTIKNHAFLGSLDPGTDVGLKFVQKPGGAFFGGQGFLLNRLKGKGWTFLNASGTILHKYLSKGESLVVDTHSLVAFENTCQYEIKRVGGAGMMFFGGQGIFNTHISGPGLVIVQSISLEKMRAALGGPHNRNEKQDQRSSIL